MVELPRERPEPALQLFARVPNLRVVVVGGDGTVGWVVGCIETLAARLAAAGVEDWTPPPVAVLPLGTGNDLARCLNWGGGHGSWRTTGPLGILAEVTDAMPALIDRWAVAVEPAAAPPPSGALAMIRAHSLGGGGGGEGGDGGRRAPGETKRMNNYLGIGVDAKVGAV